MDLHLVCFWWLKSITILRNSAVCARTNMCKNEKMLQTGRIKKDRYVLRGDLNWGSTNFNCFINALTHIAIMSVGNKANPYPNASID